MNIKCLFLFIFLYEVLSLNCVFGQQDAPSPYDPNVKYSICYVFTPDHPKLVKEAYITSVTNIGGKNFLNIKKFDVPAPDAEMQISMDSVIAIVPSTEAEDQHYSFCRLGKYNSP